MKKPIFKRPWFIVICVLIALGIVGNIVSPPTKELEDSAQESAASIVDLNTEPEPTEEQLDLEPESLPEPEAEAAPENSTHSLGMDETSYLGSFYTIAVWNELVAQDDYEAWLAVAAEDDPNRQQEENVVTYILSERFMFMLLLDDRGQMESITAIGLGDGTEASGLEIIQLLACSAEAAGTLNSDEALEMVLELISQEDKTVVGDIQYSVSITDGLGTWLTITPA